MIGARAREPDDGGIANRAVDEHENESGLEVRRSEVISLIDRTQGAGRAL